MKNEGNRIIIRSELDAKVMYEPSSCYIFFIQFIYSCRTNPLALNEQDQSGLIHTRHFRHFQQSKTSTFSSFDLLTHDAPPCDPIHPALGSNDCRLLQDSTACLKLTS